MPIRLRTSSRSTSGSVISSPSMKILPEVGSSSRFTQRSSVDLPEPEGPMTQTTSPWSTWKSMPLSTWLSPKYLCRSWTSMAGAFDGVGHQRAFSDRASMRRTTMESGTVMMQVAQRRDGQRGEVGCVVQPLAAELGQLVLGDREPEDVDQRGVLGEQDQLVGQRRQDDPERLRERRSRPSPGCWSCRGCGPPPTCPLGTAWMPARIVSAM